MELKPGLSAIVTGGASGIGKALSLALAAKGALVTVIDISESKGMEVILLLKRESLKLNPNRELLLHRFIKCDVTNSGELEAAFRRHLEIHRGLDICINSAGIGNPLPFNKDATDGSTSWRRTMDVNLTAVIDSTRFAIRAIKVGKRSGVIINIASAAGLYPNYHDPIYSGSKGGVVMFTRSLARLRHEGIRVNVLCPEFVETDMGSKVDRKYVNMLGGFIPMEMVVNGAVELIADESKAGACLWITNRRGLEYWPSPAEERKFLARKKKSWKHHNYMLYPKFEIPQAFDKIIVYTLSHNFRSATKIVRSRLDLPVKPNHVIVKIFYAGVNASDVNFSAGRYFGGNTKGSDLHLPFDAGFEAVGLVSAIGDSVQHLEIGCPVAVMAYGSYAEFVMVPAKHVIPVLRPDPEVVAMLTSGLTASISLDQAGRMGSGEVVLVTAAAGGTGQFAVQLAKLAGNRVVATCGGEDKAALLKSLGVDRTINYKNEDTKEVLKREYAKGVDIVYESVGGQMFDTCLKALAVHGRLIVIGMISQYQGESGWKPQTYVGLCEKILAKSQTVAGFFLNQYAHLWQEHMDKLFDLYLSGKLKVTVDPRKFLGLGSVADAVEYLHSGQSIGKVVVRIDPTFRQPSTKL